jgi:hypothetical protein
LMHRASMSKRKSPARVLGSTAGQASTLGLGAN